jgi:hypothetical protein
MAIARSSAPSSIAAENVSPNDTVEISAEAQARASQSDAYVAKEDSKTTSDQPRNANGEPLDEAQQKEVAKLKDRDREVRAHEAAHLASAGGHATGGPSFTYKKGPDGKQYAVGGEVNVDTSDEKTPEATLRKMQQIQRAALAPAEPSGQDHSVAAAASQKAAEARRAIAAKSANASTNSTSSEAEAGRGQRLNLVA